MLRAPDRRFRLVAAIAIGMSAVLVATSVVTHYLAYRLQHANPGAEVFSALEAIDVTSERSVPTPWSTACSPQLRWPPGA